MPKNMSLKSVSRKRSDGTEEALDFSPGVNVIVGEGNTGKTKWLETLDCLLGDDLTAEMREGNVIFELYRSARALLTIDGQDLEIERRWNEEGALGKVFVNGEPMSVRDYGRFLMARLEIPAVHFPQGNPYSARKWPELTWRTLFRHAYRQETLWSDIADRQPDIDQHACLIQFLGAAEKLFSNEYGDLVTKNKRVFELQAQRDQFMQVLDQISSELIDVQEVGVSITPESLSAARERLRTEEETLGEKRRVLLEAIRSRAEVQLAQDEVPVPDMDRISMRLVEKSGQRDAAQAAIAKAEARRAEVQTLNNLLEDELGRLERAIEAGTLLSDLKVTHCPACDRAFESTKTEGECYVCHRPLEVQASGTTAIQRVEFEREQLRAEREETGELLKALQDDIDGLQQQFDDLISEIADETYALRPLRQAAAAILPPELFLMDVEQGRLLEKLQQVDRIESILQRREQLAEEILRVQKQLAVLEGSVEEKTSDVDFASLADKIRDGMTTYLNRIQELNPSSWIGGAISFQLKERSFRFKVGDGSWRTKLGATQRLYFLFAYHYALMNLGTYQDTHFPGFLMIDFPATVEDREAISDNENFILQPYVELLSREQMKGCQMIAAGRAFEGLLGVNRIELNHVWKPDEATV